MEIVLFELPLLMTTPWFARDCASFSRDQIDFAVVAEACNGREALDIVRKGEVDVIVMDISMPEHSGVDALAAIKARAPDLPVLILSCFPEEHYATTLLRQGASGYLTKDCDPQEIVQATLPCPEGESTSLQVLPSAWPQQKSV